MLVVSELSPFEWVFTCNGISCFFCSVVVDMFCGGCLTCHFIVVDMRRCFRKALTVSQVKCLLLMAANNINTGGGKSLIDHFD